MARIRKLDEGILHDDLARIARDQRLGRGWPATFFKSGDKPRKKKDESQPS